MMYPELFYPALFAWVVLVYLIATHKDQFSDMPEFLDFDELENYEEYDEDYKNGI